MASEKTVDIKKDVKKDVKNIVKEDDEPGDEGDVEYDSDDEDNPKLTSEQKEAIIKKRQDKLELEISKYRDYYEGKDVPIDGEAITADELLRYVDELQVDTEYVTIIVVDHQDMYEHVPKEKFIPYAHIFTNVDDTIHWDRMYAYAKRNKLSVSDDKVKKRVAVPKDFCSDAAWNTLKEYESAISYGKINVPADEQLIIVQREL